MNMVDMQVNGYAGVDFNSEELSFESYVHAMKALYRDGVAVALPTLITNRVNFMTRRLALLESYRIRALEENISEVCKADYYHLEGPFISPNDGYRGAHPLEFVKELSADAVREALDEWIPASGGRIKIITLCCRGCADSADKQTAIRVIAQNGIHPALGHTDGTAEDIAAAAESGADLATHLGNACAQLLPRHHNPIWPILAEPRLWISIIADGFHLPKEMLQVFHAVKPEKTILVSDATQFAGLRPGTYQTHIGGEVVLTEQGKLHVMGHPNVLAGAACGLNAGLENAIRIPLGTREECLRLVSHNPLQFLGLSSPSSHSSL
ncbi:MAG: N-acetylglucosamine-6-phosphate deacetylase, partial [Planctomycetia bacterium]|nr:N-acetylglucosamine-6-phosphate deacetylase [Planctomycetia bacterium]